jgi:hypothetical protein
LALITKSAPRCVAWASLPSSISMTQTSSPMAFGY